MKEFLDSPNLLETIVAETERNKETANRLTANLSEQQLNWKPSSESWSIAQCLDHLAVTGAQFDSLFSEAIARGRRKWPTKTSIPYKPSMFGKWLIKLIVPENVRKTKAPKVFRPSTSSDIHGSLEKYAQQQQSFLKFVREANGLDYNKTRLRSPVTPLLRYSLGDAFVITVVHGRRHLLQVQRVIDSPGFPN